MTAKEYAKIHNCEVSGVYKKIKAGKLSIHDFESIKPRCCVECGTRYTPRSNVSRYCNKTCRYRAQEKQKKEADSISYYALRRKCSKNYYVRNTEKIKEKNRRYNNSPEGKEKKTKARHARMRNKHLREYLNLKNRMWNKAHPEKIKERQKSRVENMPVEYIKKCLKINHDIPMELVEQRRMRLKLKRKIYEIQRKIDTQ